MNIILLYAYVAEIGTHKNCVLLIDEKYDFENCIKFLNNLIKILNDARYLNISRLNYYPYTMLFSIKNINWTDNEWKLMCAMSNYHLVIFEDFLSLYMFANYEKIFVENIYLLGKDFIKFFVQKYENCRVKEFLLKNIDEEVNNYILKKLID